jgi:hypothetical protein
VALWRIARRLAPPLNAWLERPFAPIMIASARPAQIAANMISGGRRGSRSSGFRDEHPIIISVSTV